MNRNYMALLSHVTSSDLEEVRDPMAFLRWWAEANGDDRGMPLIDALYHYNRGDTPEHAMNDWLEPRKED